MHIASIDQGSPRGIPVPPASVGKRQSRMFDTRVKVQEGTQTIVKAIDPESFYALTTPQS